MSEELIEKIARATYAACPLLDPEGFAKGYKRPRQLTWNEAGVDERLHQLGCARAALAAIESSGTHVVVPVRATREMAYAAPDFTQQSNVAVEDIYDSMIFARPKVTE